MITNLIIINTRFLDNVMNLHGHIMMEISVQIINVETLFNKLPLATWCGDERKSLDLSISKGFCLDLKPWNICFFITTKATKMFIFTNHFEEIIPIIPPLLVITFYNPKSCQKVIQNSNLINEVILEDLNC